MTIGTHKGIGIWFGTQRNGARVPALGQREIAVLDALWQHGELAAQEVLQFMPLDRIGLSTVQTTLERLHRKNLLSRRKAGRAYRYRAVINKSDIISNLLRDIAADIAGGDTTAMVSGFMDYIADAAPELAGGQFDKAADAGNGDE